MSDGSTRKTRKTVSSPWTRGLAFSWLIDATLFGLLALKATGVLAWPWWRVMFPLWGGLGLLVAVPLVFNILRGVVRMAVGR